MIAMIGVYCESLNVVILASEQNAWTFTPEGARQYKNKLERIGAGNRHDLELINRNIECLDFALQQVPVATIHDEDKKE